MSIRMSNWLRCSWLASKLRPNGSARVKCASRRARLNLEELEDRCVPTVFYVNTLADLNISGGVGVTGRILGLGNTVTLRSAIEAANSTPGGNTIDLTLPGVYGISLAPATPANENNLTGSFTIIPPKSPSFPNSYLDIYNTSGGLVTVDANHLDRAFDINPGNVTASARYYVSMLGFTIENGLALLGDNLTGSGGAIRDVGNVKLSLTNMTITNNVADGNGGGVAMDNSTNSSWKLTVSNSTISFNYAGQGGGGIDTEGAGTVVINPGTVITGNTDINQGAGIYIDEIQKGKTLVSASMTMNGAVVSYNQSLAAGITASGGGISNAGNGAMNISNSTISNNVSGGNGGGFSDENNLGTLSIANSLFTYNSAAGIGGAIQEGGPSTTIASSEIDHNSSGYAGGGLFANGVTLKIVQSTLGYNTAGGGGGGIELQTTGIGKAGSTITDATIADNYAQSGAGIDASAPFTGRLNLLNDTINANEANGFGGGIAWNGTTGSAIVVQNTIIAQNLSVIAIGTDADNSAGNFTDNGGNLIGISGPLSGNTGFTNTTTQTGAVLAPLNPQLTPLQYNGGPTVGAPGDSQYLETEAPLSISPAIGKGIRAGAPATDERGLATVTNGHVNVGAVSQAPPPV